MPRFPGQQEFEQAIVRALGLPGQSVSAIDIQIRPFEPVKITVVLAVFEAGTMTEVTRTFEMATFSDVMEQQPVAH